MVSSDSEGPKDQTASGARPILRWAGSKRQLLPYLREHIPTGFSRYVEPFAGSACLFFNLQPRKALVSDINQDLILSYRILRKSPEELHGLVASWPRNKSFYYELRGRAPKSLSHLERAGRFVYLNRHSFNGVYRTNASGDFNVPRGKKTGELPGLDQFIACAKALKRASLLSADFEDVLNDAGKGDFIYLDPPYRPSKVRNRGEYGLGAFGAEDAERFVAAVLRASARGARILISYFDSQTLARQFPKWQYNRILARRYVAGFSQARNRVREILLRNY